MRRPLAALALLATLVLACTPAGAGPASGTPAAQATADIKKSKLDIAYSFIADSDVHKTSSKKLLIAGLEAIKGEIRASGGKDDVATPDFQDVSEAVLADFTKFANAAGALAAKNPQVSADRIADAAINAWLKAAPDCHTYYVNRKSEIATGGVSMQVPGPGSFARDDEAGLEGRMIAGNIGYVAWHEFLHTGTYDITKEVRKQLDKLLAQGAKAWLFDLRGNVGGDPPQTMTSWFLKDNDKIMQIQTRSGSGGVVTSKGELRLPEAYQLPIAIILNGRGGSSPEVFALGLKENKRATIVGSKSVGCLGATNLVTLPDGTRLAVTVQEFAGGVTGAKYNNVGIPPDVPADEATAIDVATKVLQDKIAGR
ncbi:MAG TPA: S41 family peptidase [Candidatus Saccharimonadales bacterium]|nr:S41 family peptidase [Candidatus Saccharimonadales bacterium]